MINVNVVFEALLAYLRLKIADKPTLSTMIALIGLGLLAYGVRLSVGRGDAAASVPNSLIKMKLDGGDSALARYSVLKQKQEAGWRIVLLEQEARPSANVVAYTWFVPKARKGRYVLVSIHCDAGAYALAYPFQSAKHLPKIEAHFLNERTPAAVTMLTNQNNDGLWFDLSQRVCAAY